MRMEADALGSRALDDGCYYGIHTLRARENFHLAGVPIHAKMVGALAAVKGAAAAANGELGFLDTGKAAAIIRAAERVRQGEFQDQFIVDALQGGAGTSTNMNMNEVLANVANEGLGHQKGEYAVIHPLDHVNLHQSTNDVFPTALRLAAIWLLADLSEACAALQTSLQQKEAEFAGVLKVGRTELQDAVPITLGQSFSAFAQAIARDRWRLYKVEERLRQVNLGGTAVGTGITAPRRYIFLVNDKLRQLAGVGLARAENMIDATQNADVFVEVSGLMKALAVNLSKIANDFRLLSSGPRAGLGEIRLPERQAGSSIMPGKVNPVIPEAVNQAAFQVMASDMAITLAAQGGQLELNPFLPLVAHHLLHSLELLTRTVKMFDGLCVQGVAADADRCGSLLRQSACTATALVPRLGYEEAGNIAKAAIAEGKSVEESAVARGMESTEVQQLLDPRNMTHPR